MRIVNIIPTYNEKNNILPMLKVLKKVARDLPEHEFFTLVVDDNSPDGTGQLVKEYQVNHPSVHLLSGPKKGLGTALLRGYQYALDQLKAEVIIPNDCDFSWDPKRIPDLLEKIAEGNDVVLASRYQEGSQTKGWSWLRKLNHWVSNKVFATWIAGIKEIKDHNGNFKAIRVKGVLDQVPINQLLEEVKVKGFAFQPYIYYELSRVTSKFYELPAVFKFRTVGEAKISKKYLKIYFWDALEYAKLCLLIRWRKLKQGLAL